MNAVSSEGRGRAAKPVPRYRLMMFQKPAAPWRPTRADAQADAIIAGMADYDHYREVVFLTVPAWIEERLGDPVPAPIRERPPALRRPVRRRARSRAGGS